MSLFLLIFALFLLPVGPYAGTTTGRAKSPPCGSGSCSDNWTGTAGQTAPSHNTAWVDLLPGPGVLCANIRLTGTGSAGIISPTSSFSNGGCLYNTSSSDTAQIVMTAMNGGTLKFDCVRSIANSTQGYCVSPAYASGGNWGKISIQRNGTELFQAATGGPWPTNVNHTLKIVVTGTTTVTIAAYVDGVFAGSTTDSTPLALGHPSFYVVGTGSYSDLLFGAWQDH